MRLPRFKNKIFKNKIFSIHHVGKMSAVLDEASIGFIVKAVCRAVVEIQKASSHDFNRMTGRV